MQPSERDIALWGRGTRDGGGRCPGSAWGSEAAETHSDERVVLQACLGPEDDGAPVRDGISVVGP